MAADWSSGSVPDTVTCKESRRRSTVYAAPGTKAAEAPAPMRNESIAGGPGCALKRRIRESTLVRVMNSGPAALTERRYLNRSPADLRPTGKAWKADPASAKLPSRETARRREAWDGLPSEVRETIRYPRYSSESEVASKGSGPWRSE